MTLTLSTPKIAQATARELHPNVKEYIQGTIPGTDSPIPLNEDAIAERIEALGAQISEDYASRELVIIPLMDGAALFSSDLLRQIGDDVSVTIRYIKVSSYGNGTTSNREPQIKSHYNNEKLAEHIKGKDVLIVDDIIDTGHSLQSTLKVIGELEPASLKTCCFLNKKERREVEGIELDYCGFDIPDAFVIGYGLDYAGHYRQLPYIGIIKEEAI